MKRTISEYIIWLLLLMPLAVVYVDNTADWGDDFAGYYEEAHNIATHQPFYHTHFAFYDYNDHYAPPYYSAGYPLLLSPLAASALPDMHLLNRYMSLWMVAWAIFAIIFLRRYFSFWPTVALMAAFYLNPEFLRCKGRVISDLPYSFFFLLSVLLYTAQRQSLSKWIGIGLCMGIAICIRSVGLVLPIVIGVYLLLSLISPPAGYSRRDLVIKTLAICCSAFLVIVSFGLLFTAPRNHYYIQQFGSVTLHGIAGNCHIYLSQLINFFADATGQTSLPAWIVSRVMVVLFAYGIIYMLLRRRTMLLWLLIVYLMVVVVFPDAQGFRYLLPVVPLIIYVIAQAVQSLMFTIVGVRSFSLGLLIVVALLYTPILTTMIRSQNKPHTYGPFTAASQHGFERLRTILPDEAMIGCVCPRVVGLMTAHRCCIIPEGQTADQVYRFSRSAPGYLLAIEERDVEVIDHIAQMHGDSLVWSADGFHLYQCRTWEQPR